MATRRKNKAVSTRSNKEQYEELDLESHIYLGNKLCETDSIGHESPPIAGSPTELAVDATDGFIPLWTRDTVLRWRFQKRSLGIFRDPDAAAAYIRQKFGEGILLWQDAAPVKFKEVKDGDAWDFEIVVMANRKCRGPGRCTLASAFFPDGGRHELKLYPNFFEEIEQEQIETMAHEIGHIFGLRHFFANITETRWRSELFGKHQPFSIMNYGNNSFMTDNDRSDLKELYRLVWSRELTHINTTPVHLVAPFSAFRAHLSRDNPIALL